MSQLQVTGEAKIRDIQGPVVANSGVITALDGAASQYVRGDGTLADFPTSTGGGSSVSYYLNGSVNQGTFAGSTYYEMSKTPIIGAGTDFPVSTNGLVAQFITDANDPDLLEVPGGNFNVEFYFSVSNNTGNPTVYAELYKYDGTTFTLLGSSVAVPESLNQGTTIAPYYFAIPVGTAALALTDRIAIRIYANVDGRTVTLHTENSHLCQVVTTFSKGMVSLNNLTDQSQFITTGTSGTNFNIVSSGDTHTFNLPVASATNTGKLSSTDWSTFNNKQNTITDPITGTGVSTGVAYFNSGTSITSEAAFNYDASTNRLGVNTSVPNATIGANAAIDSGYSLLLKNDNTNYNGIGFATDSTYGNLISTEKLGTALTRNLTLLNQSGYISLTEAGNLGVNILNPNTGLDIYNGSNAYLWLHTANSGITGTDGVRLALFSTNGANLRNFDGSFSITAEGDFSVITLGAENFKINSADGSIYQSKVANAMLKSVSGVITAAVANTDFQSPITLTTSGSSGAATFSSNTLNVPNYTLSGLGGVPTSRTLTINGTAFDLSADRSWSVGTITGSGTAGQVPYFSSSTGITSEAGFIYDASTNRLGVNTSVPNATIGADAALDSGYGLLIKTGASNYNGIGIAIDSTYGNLISTEKLGTASARNLTLLNQSGFVSLTESGNLGLNVLTPAVSGNGIDIYGSTSVGLRFHTANSGTTVSDGAGINFSAANNLGITNYEAGTIDIVTNGNSGVFVASNGFVGINGATPSVALTVNGGAAISNLTTGQIVFPTSGGTLSGTSSLFWDNANAKLGIGTSTLSGARVTITSTSEANHLQLVANAPAMTFIDAISYSYYATVGMATANNNFITGSVGGDLTLGAYNTNNIWFYNANTNTVRMRLDASGNGLFSGSVTGRGAKSQIVVDGNSVGCGISLTNTIVGANRRNWGIFTEENVEGDFVIKRSTTSGGSANTNVLSLSRDGAATFSSSVTIEGNGSTIRSGNELRFNRADNAIYTRMYDAGSLAANGFTFDNMNSEGFHFKNGGTTIMRMNSSNNVGIGTSSPTEKLEVVRTTGAGCYIKIQDTGGSNFIGTESGNMVFLNGSAAERMRITSGGNVGIGTTVPGAYVLALDYNASAAAVMSIKNSSASGYSGAHLLNNSGTLMGHFGYANASTGAPLTDAVYFGSIAAKSVIFTTSDTERMRITSGGNVLIGTSSIVNSNSGLLQVLGSTTGVAIYAAIPNGANGSANFQSNSVSTASTSWYHWVGQSGNGSSITTNNIIVYGNGNIQNTNNSYGSLSDLSIKENIKDASGKLDDLLKVKIRNYNLIGDEQKQIGVIAQELEEIFPSMIEVGIDGLKGVKYSVFVPMLIKAIQELTQKVNELENKIK